MNIGFDFDLGASRSTRFWNQLLGEELAAGGIGFFPMMASLDARARAEASPRRAPPSPERPRLFLMKTGRGGCGVWDGEVCGLDDLDGC